MLRKHALLLGTVAAFALLVIATRHYPGGSQSDSSSVGFSWRDNYVSNLFGPKAVNGVDNAARPWAVAGVFFLSGSFALFFAGFSRRIPSRVAAMVVLGAGVGAMLFALLAVTPLHDPAVIVSSTLFLVSTFYITVFAFKARLRSLAMLSVLCLACFYGCNYLYFTRTQLAWLPVMQKVSLVVGVIWMLSLHYLATASDLVPRRPERGAARA
jgi:hypothetical protein